MKRDEIIDKAIRRVRCLLVVMRGWRRMHKMMLGVKIRRGCVIAAGTVVKKSTDEYCIYAGIPAVKIGERA